MNFALVILAIAAIGHTETPNAAPAKNEASWWEEGKSEAAAEITAPVPDKKTKQSKKAKSEVTAKPIQRESENKPSPKDLSVTRGFAWNGEEAALLLRTSEGCFQITLDNPPASGLSCSEPLPLQYALSKCGESEPLEIGKTEALVTCDGSKSRGLHFRSKDFVVSAQLRVLQDNSGRQGLRPRYVVERAGPGSPMEKMLPQPELQSLKEEAADSPIKFEASGFAGVEYEISRNFGYDTGGTGLTAAPNFANTGVVRPKRRVGSFFSNISATASKDQTSLTGVLEIGEIYFGDSGTGGAQGARANNVFELRNLYLTHQAPYDITAKAGVITSISDPRSFIYNDHTASLHAAYSGAFLDVSAWHGSAQKSRPTANYQHDRFSSIQASLKTISGLKNTMYLTHRGQSAAAFAEESSPGVYNTLNGRADS